MSSSVTSSEASGTAAAARDHPGQHLDHHHHPGERSSTNSNNTEEALVNPTVETLAEGICGLLQPTLQGLDERVTATKAAQKELRDQIESLTSDLEDIETAQAADHPQSNSPKELETAINKLNQAKKRVVVVANLLQGAQVVVRLKRKLQETCFKDCC